MDVESDWNFGLVGYIACTWAILPCSLSKFNLFISLCNKNLEAFQEAFELDHEQR